MLVLCLPTFCPRVLEFGAVNVTGFRLIDPQSEFVSQFNRQWKKYPLAASSGPPVSYSIQLLAINGSYHEIILI